MRALVIAVFENNGIYTLIISVFNGELTVSNSFEIHVTFYPTADRNECTYFMKLELCFLVI